MPERTSNRCLRPEVMPPHEEPAAGEDADFDELGISPAKSAQMFVVDGEVVPPLPKARARVRIEELFELRHVLEWVRVLLLRRAPRQVCEQSEASARPHASTAALGLEQQWPWVSAAADGAQRAETLRASARAGGPAQMRQRLHRALELYMN